MSFRASRCVCVCVCALVLKQKRNTYAGLVACEGACVRVASHKSSTVCWHTGVQMRCLHREQTLTISELSSHAEWAI